MRSSAWTDWCRPLRNKHAGLYADGMWCSKNPVDLIMDKARTILVYSDYKSPCAFLAKDLIYELEDQFDVHLEWLPYTLDIPSYLGSAQLDERGEIIESDRNAHQWRRVRYSYMDSSPRSACCGPNVKAKVRSGLITIVSLNASGDASLTSNAPKRLLPC
jgi:hypothetical protein